MISSVFGQCEFPTYEKYGLICDEARFLCGYEMDGFIGRLLADKSPLPQPDPLCAGAGEADNIQWFSFVTDDVNVEIVIRYSNCSGNVLSPGLQVGIFENCELADDFSPLGSIYCIEDINYTDIVLTPDPLDIEVGQLYLLFVDGYAGSACDFEIEVIQGVCTDAPDQAQVCEQDCGIVAQYPGNQGCTLFRDNFTFTPSSQIIDDLFGCNPAASNTRLDSIICVEWEIQPDMGFNFISSSFIFYDSMNITSTLTVEWTNPGAYTIKPILSINPLFSTCQEMCVCSDDVVYTIDITESTIIQLPPAELCPGECVDFCNQTFCETGIEECFNRALCEIEVLSIIEKPNVEIDQGLFYLCPGECFEFQNSTYCDVDNYAISDSASCDTTYLFELENLVFSIDLVLDDALLTCTISQAFLEGEWNTNFTGNIFSAWVSELGDTLAFGNEYTALDGGEYTYVAWPEGMKGCAISLTHTVIKDDAVPEANIIAPFLDCNNLVDLLNIDTQDDIISANWSGPNGFISNDINAQISETGNYEVTLTASNGCELVLETEVMGDYETPDVELEYYDWTCSEEIPTSLYSTTSSIDSHIWMLPDGSNSSNDILNLNDLGNYSLEVTAMNGCTDLIAFEVVDLSYDPSLQLNDDRIWRCTDTEMIFDLSSQEILGLDYIWTNIEGAFLSNSINLVIYSPGIYILTTQDENLECIGNDTIRVIEDPNPFVDIEFTTLSPFCIGGSDGSIEILSIAGGEAPYVIELDGELYSDVTKIELAPGSYTLNVIDAFDCTVTKAIDIPAAEEIIVTIDPELSIRYGQSQTLTFETNLDESEISVIEWTDEAGEILGLERDLIFIGRQIEFIYLKVESLEGCEVISQIKVNLNFEVDIYYPNVFSPNSDGNNDHFVLYNNGFPEMADDLKIFDRSGELIYKSSQTHFNDSHVGWDGTFNGDQCQPGVYVFILEYTLVNGYKKTLAGSITLVR
jgi:gliding motility-associated-like protein